MSKTIPKSTFVTKCDICDTAAMPGESMLRHPTSGKFVHTDCFKPEAGNAQSPPSDHDNQKAEQKSSPEPEVVALGRSWNTTCPICDREISPEAEVVYNETGMSAHRECDRDAKRSKRKKGKIEPEESPPSVTPDQVRGIVVEVLAECFGGVDFSFLDQAVEQKVSEALQRRETPF